MCWCRKGVWDRGRGVGLGVGTPGSLPVLCRMGQGKTLSHFMGPIFSSVTRM